MGWSDTDQAAPHLRSGRGEGCVVVAARGAARAAPNARLPANDAQRPPQPSNIGDGGMRVAPRISGMSKASSST